MTRLTCVLCAFALFVYSAGCGGGNDANQPTPDEDSTATPDLGEASSEPPPMPPDNSDEQEAPESAEDSAGSATDAPADGKDEASPAADDNASSDAPQNGPEIPETGNSP